MISYRLFLCLVLTLVTQIVYGQLSDSDKSCCLERPPSWIIKFAPLSLLDPDNTIQFGVERLLKRHHAVQAEFGYGWQDIGLWDVSSRGRFSSKQIWRSRAEWRFYLESKKALGQYIAVEGFYKQVNVLENNIGSIPCSSGSCPTGTLERSPVIKQVWSGNVKFGYQIPQSTDNQLVLDLYAGLGIRYRQVSRPNLPVGFTLSEENGLLNLFPAFPVASQTTVSLVLGLKFGYAF